MFFQKFLNFFKKRTKPVIVLVPGINWSCEGAFQELSNYLSDYRLIFHDTGSWFGGDFKNLNKCSDELALKINSLKSKEFIFIGWSYGCLVINKAFLKINKNVKKTFFINSTPNYKNFVTKKDFLKTFLKLDEITKFLVGLSDFKNEANKTPDVKNIFKHLNEYLKNDDILNIPSKKVLFIGSSEDVLVPMSVVKKGAKHWGSEFYSLAGSHRSLIQHPKELALIIKNNLIF